MKIGDTITIVFQYEGEPPFLATLNVENVFTWGVTVNYKLSKYDRHYTREGVSWLRGDQCETSAGQALLTAATLAAAGQAAS